MKKVLFVKSDYKRMHLAWSDGDKVRHRICLVHNELLNDFRHMKKPIILGFCDKYDGFYSLMNVDNGD